MTPVRADRLARDLDPSAEVAGLHPSGLIPRHLDRAKETEPAQQRQPVGPLRGLRPTARLKLPEERGHRRDHLTRRIKQPERLERIPTDHQGAVLGNDQGEQVP